MELNGFNPEDFAHSHPGGALGKALTVQLSHLLQDHKKPAVQLHTPIAEVISEISTKLVGATAVLNNEKVVGIITDGDLRRMMQSQADFTSLEAKDIMSEKPVLLSDTTLAKEALILMQQKGISQIVVAHNELYCGIVHIHDILNEGIY
jgi:arabinose-5-phosphate isomerase